MPSLARNQFLLALYWSPLETEYLTLIHKGTLQPELLITHWISKLLSWVHPSTFH